MDDDTPVAVPLLGSMDRRRFLGVLGVGGGAIAATAWVRPSALFSRADAATAAATNSNVIVEIFLRGAADGLSFVAPLGDATLQRLRPGVAISDASALALDSRFGLHPAMGRIKGLFDAGRAAFVPAAGSPNPNRSHFSAQAMMDHGAVTESSTTTGWLGRYLRATTGSAEDPLRAVGIGTSMSPALSGSSAIATPNLQSMALTGAGAGASSTQIATALRAMYPTAASEPLRAAASGGLDVVAEIAPIAAGSAPPTTWPKGFGTALWPIAKLIAEGFPIEVATADLGGWDEHDAMGSPTDPNANQTKLVAGLDAAIGAFFDWIGPAADRTTVVITTEFGRRIALNGSGGTDHGRGMVMMVLGGGVRAGVHGDWPGLVDTDAGDVRVVNDYRRVFAEVLGRRGRATDLAAVFPGIDVRPSTWLGVTAA